MGTHAILSPSSAHRWMNCPGSVALEAPIPNESSAYADEGSNAHHLAELCLLNGDDANNFIGITLEDDGRTFEVDPDMASYIQTYLDVVRGYADGHELMVEQRVPIGHITGEQDAGGTSDAIIVTSDGRELIVADLKYGRGVAVSAENNEQGQIYALGALEFISLLGYEPERVRIIIHQPRISETPSEWACTVDELKRFGGRVKQRASHALATLTEKPGALIHHLRPGEKPCKFCRAKAVCPALAQRALSTVADDFVDMEKPITPQIVHRLEATMDNAVLGNMLGAVDLIESWCKAIRGRAETELLHGHSVPGYKLVQGKRGNRAWTSDAEAEGVMKSMRLKQDEMYSFKLITPTAAEKLLKDTPRRWNRLQALITQSEGSPSVAPESDKRPALVMQPSADDFEDVSQELAEDLV